jgi:hypothetical protein
MSFAAVSGALADESQEAVTTADGILCLVPSSLLEANQPAVAKSQQRLQKLGCLRAGAGIRLTVIDGHKVDGPHRIRFYPEGISAGLTLWGLPSSFKLPEDSASLRRSIDG